MDLNARLHQQQTDIQRAISERNARFFEVEADKLDGWADDLPGQATSAIADEKQRGSAGAIGDGYGHVVALRLARSDRRLCRFYGERGGENLVSFGRQRISGPSTDAGKSGKDRGSPEGV
jgi:hypothetical protein